MHPAPHGSGGVGASADPTRLFRNRLRLSQPRPPQSHFLGLGPALRVLREPWTAVAVGGRGGAASRPLALSPELKASTEKARMAGKARAVT